MKPTTRRIDPGHAMATLDYEDMRNLSALFEGWATGTRRLDQAQREKVLAWSADYKDLAVHCGPEWRATAPEDPPDPVAFIARRIRQGEKAGATYNRIPRRSG